MNENYKVYQMRKQATKKQSTAYKQVVQRTPPRQDEYNTTIE